MAFPGTGGRALRLAALQPPRLRRLMPLAMAALLVVAALGIGPGASTAGAAPDRDELARFMWAMAGQESGWDYYARNRVSGAFGKYQIMPFNWPAWAEKYVGDRRADQTPWNQERVARGKLRDLYRWLGSWKRVAYWWLTGSSEKDEKRWSGYAKGYVRNIMALRQEAPPGGAQMPSRTSSRAKAGDWRRAGSEQRLRLAPGGRAWPRRGRLRDGQVLKVRASTKRAGVRWIAVVSADGRLGWLPQPRTVPAHAPKKPRRWSDITDRGRPVDRRLVRPQPR